MYSRGEKFQYNNTGFVLLGIIMETVTGMPFDQYLQKILFEPAGMTHTGYYETDRLPGNCANAYMRDRRTGEMCTNIFAVDAKGTGAGGVYTTAEDMAQMLYNIGHDDNMFLNINSQSDIIDIMGKVKNTTLIKAGLPAGVDFIHKTGDIGTMLGDAGIVYLPSGQRYIVVILAKRPHNHINGRLYIQEASKIIYNYMSLKN